LPVKNAVNTGLKICVSAGLLYYLLTQFEFDGLRQELSHTRPELFALAAFFFVVSNILGALQWHRLLQAQDLPVSFRQALIFYFVGVFFNNVLLGNIGGDALRIYDIRRLTGSATAGVAATVVDRFIGLFSTCSLALGAYVLLGAFADTNTLLVPALAPVWFGLILFMALGLSQRLGNMAETAAQRFLPAGLANPLVALRRSFGIYRHRIGLLAGVWLISLTVQFSRILVYWCAGLAVGMSPGLLYFVCFQPVAAVAAALPISIGGLGVREGTLVQLFSGLGVAAEKATAMSLLGYSAGILASLIGGIAFVLRRVERHNDAETEDQAKA
jgi:glycosyltransferase 2 family protein